MTSVVSAFLADAPESTRVALFLARREQSNHPTQVFPGSLVERRLGTDEFADHIPGRHVQRAIRRQPHGQRHRALRAEANPAGG